MLCETFAPAAAAVEIYLDEEHLPAAWNFVCGAQDLPVPLPVSNSGAPSAAYYPPSEPPIALESWQEAAAAGSQYAVESGTSSRTGPGRHQLIDRTQAANACHAAVPAIGVRASYVTTRKTLDQSVAGWILRTLHKS